MSHQRPNFYELLGLDPAVDDETEIQRVIDLKKKRWNQARAQQTGQRRARAEAALGWVDEMRRVLGDPVTRHAEAEARRRQLEAAKRSAYEELDRRIETLRSLGGCSHEQLERLVEQLAGRLERHEIEQHLAAAGIAVGATGHSSRAPFVPRAFLEDSMLEEIQHALGVLDEASLYTFVGASPQTPAGELVERARQRYKDCVGQSDERATRVQKLAGIAEVVFLVPDGKERYEASIATLPLRGLHGDIDLMTENGELRHEAFQRIARAAEEHGVDPDLARSYVGWYAAERDWTIAEPAAQDGAAGFEQLFNRVEETLDRFHRERQQDHRRWAEERRRMEEAAKVAENIPRTTVIQDPPPPPPPESDTTRPPMRGLQPPSPRHVESVGRGFHLQWPPVPGAKISYWVVRKRDSYPEDEGDGELHQQVFEPGFEDLRVPKGSWYYAVFTLRDDQTSLDAAVSGPHKPKTSSAPKAVAASTGIAAAIAAAVLMWPPAGNNQNQQGGGGPPPPTPPPPIVVPPPPPAGPSLPPPVVKPKQDVPLKPRVAVLAGGDRQLIPTVERKLLEELAQRGVEVVERNQLIALDDHLVRGGRASISQLLSGSSLEGADVLVYADVDRLGERELRFLGRSELAITSQIGVEAYLVAEQKSLGPGWSEQFEYTQVNLGQKLGESAYALGDDIRAAVDSGWSEYRQRRGLSP